MPLALLLWSETNRYSEPPVSLNPFGSLFTLLSWAILLGVNFYCLWRLLRSGRLPKDREGS